jgi:elongation factor Ts
MTISVAAIKELRNITNGSIADCKKILTEADGDIKKAIELMRKRGLEMAAKKQDRVAKEGRIECYIHNGNKIGVLIDVSCETDFVAKNEDFAKFAKDLAMQIAACNPKYIKKEDVPADIVEVLEDKAKYYKEHCLLEQAFIKDASLSINDCLGSMVAKMGESISVRRFMRYKVGE